MRFPGRDPAVPRVPATSCSPPRPPCAATIEAVAAQRRRRLPPGGAVPTGLRVRGVGPSRRHGRRPDPSTCPSSSRRARTTPFALQLHVQPAARAGGPLEAAVPAVHLDASTASRDGPEPPHAADQLRGGHEGADRALPRARATRVAGATRGCSRRASSTYNRDYSAEASDAETSGPMATVFTRRDGAGSPLLEQRAARRPPGEPRPERAPRRLHVAAVGRARPHARGPWLGLDATPRVRSLSRRRRRLVCAGTAVPAVLPGGGGHRSLLIRRASSSGRSSVAKWPQSGTLTTVAPGMRQESAFAARSRGRDQS